MKDEAAGQHVVAAGRVNRLHKGKEIKRRKMGEKAKE